MPCDADGPHGVCFSRGARRTPRRTHRAQSLGLWTVPPAWLAGVTWILGGWGSCRILDFFCRLVSIGASFFAPFLIGKSRKENVPTSGGSYVCLTMCETSQDDRCGFYLVLFQPRLPCHLSIQGDALAPLAPAGTP